MSPFNNGSVDNLLVELVDQQLRKLRGVVGVRGSLVASTDGRSVSCDVVESTPGAAAAITASSLGLASRLSQLTATDSSLQELQARTTHGYVCIYAVGEQWLLAIITDLSVNLAKLKLDTREVVVALSKLAATKPAAM